MAVEDKVRRSLGNAILEAHRLPSPSMRRQVLIDAMADIAALLGMQLQTPDGKKVV